MSHVSTTAHYNLPIYGGNDIINPLTDVNGTNEAVDTAIYEVSQALASGVTDITDIKNKVGDTSLDTASQTLSGAINELKAVNDAQTGDITDIEANVGTLQTQMATTTGNITTLNTTVAGLQTEVSGKASQSAVNTLATKVGTDALITTAQDLSGAVNELKNDVDELVPKTTPDVHVVSDGTINLQQFLKNVGDVIDFSKLSKNSILVMKRSSHTYYFHDLDIDLSTPSLGYGFNGLDSTGIYTDSAYICRTLSDCKAMYSKISGTSALCVDQSTIATNNGDYFDIYY